MDKQWLLFSGREMSVSSPLCSITERFFRNADEGTKSPFPPSTNTATSFQPTSSDGRTDVEEVDKPDNDTSIQSASSQLEGVETSAQTKHVITKKSRRGGKKNIVENDLYIRDKFVVYHTNIQSANARLNSLESIVNSHDVDIITVNETNMKKNKKFQVDGFKCIFRNRQNSHMGGVATCFREYNVSDTLVVSKGEKEEYIVTAIANYL